MTPALEVRDLTVAFGRNTVVDGVSVDVAPGQVVGLVGPNGAGKTTFVDAVTGFVPCSGAVSVGGVDAGHLRPHRRAALGMARTFQSLELFEDLTVGENLAVTAEAAVARGDAGDSAADRVARAAARAGLDDVLDVLPGRLSHGRRKQVALGRALAGAPSLVLLDEPAAGLDTAERAALASTLRALAGDGVAVLLVDHDVHLVFDVCDDVTVIDEGRVVAHGPPAQVRADPAVAVAWLGPERPSERGAGPERPSERGAGPERPSERGAGPGRPEGPPALDLEGMSGGWRGVPAVHEIDLTVGRGEMVALLGANGAGKTTTLLTVAGVLAVMGGAVQVDGRPSVADPAAMARRGVALAPQDRGVLAGLTVGEQLRLAAGPARARRSGVAAALDRFPALRPLVSRRGGLLSGGEQQQLALARAVAARPHLLLVDELSLGLAPVAVGHCLTVLRELANEGVAVLMVEQFAPLALEVADRAYVLHRGRVVLSGDAADLASRPEALESAYLGSA